MEQLHLNVSLLRRRVPNLTKAAKSVGLRPATVSNLCTGKISVGRTEVRTLVALANLAGCSLDELIIQGERYEMIETGIKSIDLFAPLAKNGTAGLVARPGMGQLVVLAEIFHRLKNHGYKIVLLHPEGDHPEVNDLKKDLDVICYTVKEAEEEVQKLGKAEDVLFIADRSYVIKGTIVKLQESWNDLKSVTTFLLDLKGEAVDENLPYGPLETLWHFDSDLAARRIYPAIHPLQSTSTVLEGANLEQNHFYIQQKAKKHLRRYKELRSIVQVGGMDPLSSADQQVYKRGELLEAYLSQPFYVAEPFTGVKGEHVPLDQTLMDTRKILDGAEDHKLAKELMSIGSLL
ncbi:ATP synthase beta subunit C-terminal domain-containing protein [Halobacillus mangrovi]|uniref:ATP synthase A/B type C-terminal domain-containing protein n=1 Tax=Halobacillus mangrovi TaxID=402384 RepID=A0A1W5ZRG9_9BACI|nr:hypothetical protein [Halobacillus mangrovi]ARI75871.1 hypothetical protein HM131_03080 [Halobacillus mangrovi]